MTARFGSRRGRMPSLVALMLLVACGGEEPRSADTPRNVILISVDTLRADHLGAWGYPLETSPNIDAFVAEGVSFETAMAPRGLTWPSLATLLTSLPPDVHGVRENGRKLAPEIRSLSEHLKEHGYATAAFLGNMRSAWVPRFDLVRGWDGFWTDRGVARRAIRWLEGRPPEPFFLWIHFIGPHAPYLPARENRERFDTGYLGLLDGTTPSLVRISRRREPLRDRERAHVVSLYDGEVRGMDEEFGRVMAALDALGLGDETVVAFTSDHGEELGERRSYFFHRCSIYDSVLRVPLAFRLPGVVPAGRRLGGVARLVDVAPTILDLVGIPAPPAFQGRSLRPRMDGAPSGADAAPAFAEIGDDVRSLRTDRWRLVAPALPGGPVCEGPKFEGEHAPVPYAFDGIELYDHAVDPGERDNVADRNPEVVSRLRAVLDARFAQAPPPVPAAIDPDSLEELRALGYVP